MASSIRLCRHRSPWIHLVTLMTLQVLTWRFVFYLHFSSFPISTASWPNLSSFVPSVQSPTYKVQHYTCIRNITKGNSWRVSLTSTLKDSSYCWMSTLIRCPHTFNVKKHMSMPQLKCGTLNLQKLETSNTTGLSCCGCHQCNVSLLIPQK